MKINLHTPAEFDRAFRHKFSPEDCRQMNVLGREEEIEEMGRVMALWPPQTEEDWEESLRCRAIIAPWVTGNHWLFRMKRKVLISPPLSLSRFRFFMSPSFFRFLYSAIYLRSPFFPFHSALVSLSLSPWFWRLSEFLHLCTESKINPIISVWHSHTAHCLCLQSVQNSQCEEKLYVWKRYPQRDSGQSKLIVSVGSRCQAV